MGNYPNVKYGDASAGAGGGGGGAAGTLPFDPAERGAAVGIVTKDVVPKQQDPGPPPSSVCLQFRRQLPSRSNPDPSRRKSSSLKPSPTSSW